MQKRGSQPTQKAVNSFFKKKTPAPTTTTTPIVLEVSSQTTTTTPPPTPPATKRCGKYDSLEKRLKSLNKYKTEGNWKKHALLESKLSWTEVIQTFEHIPSGRRVELFHFAPYGMAQYISDKKSIRSCSSSFNVLPKEVQDEMADLFDKDSFNSCDLTVSARNTGQKAPKAFYRVYCDFCEKEVLPEVITKFKSILGEDATFLDLVNKWDSLPDEKGQHRAKFIDVIGCFLPNAPNDVRCSPGPN